MTKSKIARSGRDALLGLAAAAVAGFGCNGSGREPAVDTEAVVAPLSSNAAPQASDHQWRPHRFGEGRPGGLAPQGNFFGQTSYAPCQPSHLALHGGQPITGATNNTAKVVPVSWGSQSALGYSSTDYDTFWNNSFGGSSWWNWIRDEYHLANVSKTQWYPLMLSPGNAGKTKVTRADIEAELLYQLNNGTLPIYATGWGANGMLYVIHFPSTVFIDNYIGTGTSPQNDFYCGGPDGKTWLSGTGCASNEGGPTFTFSDGSHISYIIMPDQTKGSCATSCGDRSLTALQNQTLAESHELIEALSDPWSLNEASISVHGWYATNGCQQMADMCNWSMTTTGGATVTRAWSNAANRCGDNSPGALADVNGKGTSAILLSGDPDPGTTATVVHTAQSALTANALPSMQPSDVNTTSDWITAQKKGQPIVADFTGDGIADFALPGATLGTNPLSVLPVMASDGAGNFSFNGGGLTTVGAYPEIASSLGAPFTDHVLQTSYPPVTGDFNGDGFADMVLTGGPGWTFTPIAFGTKYGNGQFWAMDAPDYGLNDAIAANSANPLQFVAADFNGDGLTDVALVGLAGADYIVVGMSVPNSSANSRGDGTFGVQNIYLTPAAGGQASDFNNWAATPGVKAVGGDFDGDGFGDIALAGGQGWTTVPIVYARNPFAGSVSFVVTNNNNTANMSAFASAASQPRAQVVMGDFNGDGISDLATVGGAGSTEIDIALGESGLPGSMSWLANSTSLGPFTQAAARANTFATSAGHGGRFSFTAPTVPNLVASGITNAVSLAWSAPGGAYGYDLLRGTTANGESTTPVASNLTGTTYTDNGLVAGTKYYYKVVAKGVAGSSTSAEASATPVPAIPAVPTLQSVTAGDAQVTVTYTASLGASSYTIYYTTTAGGEATGSQYAGQIQTTVTIGGLTNGTKYYFKVAAVGTGGSSAMSNELSATPMGAAPAAPTLQTATAGTSQVALTWTASAGATSYTLYRSTTAGGEATGTAIPNISTTSYTNTALTGGTKYYYKVVALKGTAASAMSNELNATPVAPVTLPLSINSGGAATGSWIADIGTGGTGKVLSTANPLPTVNTSLLTGTIPPQAVLIYGRIGTPLTYTIKGLPPNSNRTVTIYSVENYFNAAGKRVFTVSANGTVKTPAIDVWSVAKAQFKAVMNQFTASTDGNGQIVLSFNASVNNATVSGIVVQ
jgi:fibronectin type 3 domain-containing protein